MVGLFFMVLMGSTLLHMSQLTELENQLSTSQSRDFQTIQDISELAKRQQVMGVYYPNLLEEVELDTPNYNRLLGWQNKLLKHQTRFDEHLKAMKTHVTDWINYSQNVPHMTKLSNRLAWMTTEHNQMSGLLEEVFTQVQNRNLAGAKKLLSVILKKDALMRSQLRILSKDFIDQTSAIAAQTKSKIKMMKSLNNILSIVSLFMAVLLAVTILRTILKQIRHSQRMAKAIEAGEDIASIQGWNPDDELGKLMVSMQSMVYTIKNKEKEIRKINTEYEKKVINATQDLKSKNLELGKDNNKLQYMNQMKSEFLGMAAHDLCNPVSILNAYSDMLLTGCVGELSEEQKKILNNMKHNFTHMMDMIGNLMDMAMIEAGKLELQQDKVDDIKELVEECCDAQSINAKNKNIQIQIHATENLNPTFIDKSRIRQVVNNLLSNAIKYSHKDTLININLANQNDSVRIDVQDHGQGIPKDEQGKLFQSYSKTSVRPTAGEKSTGLGLSIVKKIVEAHGRDITVTSEEGQGSTFSFEVPTV